MLDTSKTMRWGSKEWNKLVKHVNNMQSKDNAKMHHKDVSTFIRHSVQQQIKKEKK